MTRVSAVRSAVEDRPAAVMVSLRGPGLQLGTACLPIGRMIQSRSASACLTSPAGCCARIDREHRASISPSCSSDGVDARELRRPAPRRRIRAAKFWPTNLSGLRSSIEGPGCEPARSTRRRRGERRGREEREGPGRETACGRFGTSCSGAPAEFRLPRSLLREMGAPAIIEGLPLSAGIV